MVRPINPKSKTQIAFQYLKENPESTPKQFKAFWRSVFPLCKNHKQYRYLGFVLCRGTAENGDG